MSEDRDQAGSPVEQVETTDTQVLAAVERAAEVATPATPGAATPGAATPGDATVIPVELGGADAAVVSTLASERPVIAAQIEPPNAAKLETAEEIFASHPVHSSPPVHSGSSGNSGNSGYPAHPGSSALAASTSSNAETTAGSNDSLGEALAASEPVHSDYAGAAQPGAVLPPARDGEIRISSDHPMAALYMQTPMAPDARGNRGAGVLIALLSAVAFALVYAGVLSLWLAPNYPPSTFLNEGLLPWVLNWGFAAAVTGYFIGLALLVVIVGRAGWWAYVLGGLLVAILTWAMALLGFALDARLSGSGMSMQPYSLLIEYGLFFPVVAAAIVAREVSVWFGAWIGARGRKMKRQNAEAIAEYEAALTEVQAKQL